MARPICNIATNITIVKSISNLSKLGPIQCVENPLIRRPSGFHSLARSFIPWLGVSELEKTIINVSAALEDINNASADAIKALQVEVTSLKEVTLQNRLGLDVCKGRRAMYSYWTTLLYLCKPG